MSRNTKIFIYVSLFIHLSCGVALYMYYFNPSAPQPLRKDKAEESQPEVALNSLKASSGQTLRTVKKKKSRDKRRTVKRTAKNKKTSLTDKNSHFKPAESQKTSEVSVQKERPPKEQSRSSLDPAKKKEETQNLSGEKNSLSDSKDSFISGNEESQKTHEGKAAKADLKVGNVSEKTPRDEKKTSLSSRESEADSLEEEAKGKLQSPLSDSPDGKTDLKAEEQQPETKLPKTSQPKSPPPGEDGKSEQLFKSAKAKTSPPKSSPPEEDGKPRNPLPNSVPEKIVSESQDQATSPKPSVPPKKTATSMKNTEKEQAPVNGLKQSSSSSGFRDFTDMKQKRGNPNLDYPYEAREKKMQGRVSILYFVTPEGLVDQIQLEKSSGHSLLDNFVLRTVARYEFFPQQESWVRHTVEFILKGEEVQNLKMRDGE